MDTMAGTETKKRPRRRHTDEFRSGAVRLVLKERRPVAQVARDLDISASLLHLWVRQAKVDAGEGPELQQTGALSPSCCVDLVGHRLARRSGSEEVGTD